MAITNRNQILPTSNPGSTPAYRAGWDAITSNPTIDVNGRMTSPGTELSGSGATLNVVGMPHFESAGSFPGMVCSPAADVNLRGGILITFPAAMTLLYQRKILGENIHTPQNMIGDNSKSVGTLWITDASSGRMNVQKNWVNGAGGLAANAGKTTFNGGNGTAQNTTLNGCETQMTVAYSNSTAGAFGFVNTAASKSGTANGNNNTIQRIAVGFIPIITALTSGVTAGSSVNMPVSDSTGFSLGANILIGDGTANVENATVTAVPDGTHVTVGVLAHNHNSADAVITADTNNPYVGKIHNAHYWLLDSTTAAGVQFLDSHVTDDLDFGSTEWGVERNQTKQAVSSGDSINYTDARFKDGVTNTGALTLGTTLTSSIAANVSQLPVVASAGFTGRLVLDPGTEQAEVVTVTGLPDGTHINITGRGAGNTTFFAHSNGCVVNNGGSGFTSPHDGADFVCKSVGYGSGTQLFKFDTPGAKASSNTANPPGDGSFSSYQSGMSEIIHFIQRGSNDFQIDSASAATVLGYTEAEANNAKGNSPAATYVIGEEVTDRNDFSGAQRTASRAYNVLLRASGKFSSVAKHTDHDLMTDPANSGSITFTGATLATTITGLIYDPLGVHHRAFGNACRALMKDKAVYGARGIPVPYAPLTPTVTVVKSGTSYILTFSTPTSSGAPKMYGTSTDGPSALRIKIKRGGSVIVLPPLAISANTGAVDWTGRLTYTDTTNHGNQPYTSWVEDAAGNPSLLVRNKAGSGSGGRSSRTGRESRTARC